MKKYFETLKNCPLFKDITDDDMEPLLKCLPVIKKSYEKNSYIFRADETVSTVGVVLTGAVHVLQEDFWGRRTILLRVEPGGLFAEAFVCAEIKNLPVNILAVEQSKIVLIDYKKIISSCSSACTFHAALIKNMMRTLAEKNVMLTQKIEHITRNTTREKLLSYLSEQALKSKSRSFEIPFNRQQLADYLSVERSAMSGELCRMRDDGLIKFDKNRFVLSDVEN